MAAAGEERRENGGLSEFMLGRWKKGVKKGGSLGGSSGKRRSIIICIFPGVTSCFPCFCSRVMQNRAGGFLIPKASQLACIVLPFQLSLIIVIV